jgi:hypothetical protein
MGGVIRKQYNVKNILPGSASRITLRVCVDPSPAHNVGVDLCVDPPFPPVSIPADVAKYYGQEMITLGWELFNETNMPDVIMQIWSKLDTNATVTIVVQDGKTSVVIALPK